MSAELDARPLVAHVIVRLAIGGLENGLVNLINHMPAERYRHVVICLKNATDFAQRIRRPDVEIHALGKREGKDLPSYLRLWRLLRRLRPDLVHTRNVGTLDSMVPAALAGVRHRVHGEHGWEIWDLHGTSRKSIRVRRWLRPLIARYVAVSRDLQHWLVQRIGVAPTHVAQIYNGVDIERFHPARDGDRGALPAGFAPEGVVVIGGAGRMSPVKDPLNLVRAFVRLLERDPAARGTTRLMFVGDGELRAEAERLLAQAGVAELAWLPGMRDDVPRLMRAMDLFVLPSLNEGISNTILEAMATGLPVVATDVGGNPELVVGGENGTLVPSGDADAMAGALERYVRDAALRRDHGARSRRRVEADFSLEVMVRRYLEVYDSVLDRG